MGEKLSTLDLDIFTIFYAPFVALDPGEAGLLVSRRWGGMTFCADDGFGERNA